MESLFRHSKQYCFCLPACLSFSSDCLFSSKTELDLRWFEDFGAGHFKHSQALWCFMILHCKTTISGDSYMFNINTTTEHGPWPEQSVDFTVLILGPSIHTFLDWKSFVRKKSWKFVYIGVGGAERGNNQSCSKSPEKHSYTRRF